MGFEKINSTSALADLCEQARSSGRIGLDTEFLWERTYSPLICLVQINVDGQVAIADPLDKVELEPLADVLSDPDIEVVMHAPHADLVAFALRCGATPQTIFDTQLSAGFIGLSAGLSYERLVNETTGETVQPSESFTDWSRRPLNSRQLRYAAEDVEHLFDVADHIQSKLRDMGRLQWANEEMERRFGEQGRLVTQPDDAWRKVARRGKLRPNELGILREVAAWRERTARQRDIPTSWVMKDPSLVELARRKPSNTGELSKIRGVDGSMRKGDARELLDAIAAGRESEPIEEGVQPPRGVRRRVTIAKGLAAALLRARCESAEIASELVGTTSDVEELISWVAAGEKRREHAPTPALLRGWREEFGSELVDLVEGRLQLSLSTREPYLVVEHLDR